MQAMNLTKNILVPNSEKQNYHYILYCCNKIMNKILQKIKRIDGFILGTFTALFLAIAMILFYATIDGK